MKRLLRLIPLIIVTTFVVAAYAPAVQGYVALPDVIQEAIVGLVVAAFALGVDYLIGILPPALGWIGDFLKKYQMEWALALGAALVTWIENALPTGYEDVSIKGITFLLAVIFIFVPYLSVRKALAARGVRAFQPPVKVKAKVK